MKVNHISLLHEPMATNPYDVPRKPYTPPNLRLFGQVASLTESVTCSANNDGNQACVSGASGTMGVMA